ncbi:MAG: hypothetical protein QOG75_5750 [Mycobacterium sp.]|nr:hypothetical protein [Mycobacterium sp.]
MLTAFAFALSVTVVAIGASAVVMSSEFVGRIACC